MPDDPTIEAQLIALMIERQNRLIRSVTCASARRRDEALIAQMAQDQQRCAAYVHAREMS